MDEQKSTMLDSCSLLTRGEIGTLGYVSLRSKFLLDHNVDLPIMNWIRE